MAEFYMLQKIVGKIKELFTTISIQGKENGSKAFSNQIQDIFHKKAILLTLTPDPQGSPTKHFQMQSLRTVTCNSTKYYHEAVITAYHSVLLPAGYRGLQVILACYTALAFLSLQASIHIPETVFSLQIFSVNKNI